MTIAVVMIPQSASVNHPFARFALPKAAGPTPRVHSMQMLKASPASVTHDRKTRPTTSERGKCVCEPFARLRVPRL